MTLSRKSTLSGELVRDYWRYEYDALEIGGQDVADFLLARVEAVRTIPDPIIPQSAEKTYYGRVRLTIEVID